MRFAERQVNFGAEPLSASELREGLIYFSVYYNDAAMLLPSLEPLVYLGKDLDSGDPGELYFQDIESHRRGVRLATATKSDEALFILESEEAPSILDYEGALSDLMWCSLKRRGLLRGYSAGEFEERELKPNDEPLTASELEVGCIYFSVLFADDHRLIPTLDPLIFIGKDLDAGDSGKFYFQDVDSHRRDVRFGMATNDDYAYFLIETDDTPRIFDYERALEALMRCALRRVGVGEI